MPWVGEVIEFHRYWQPTPKDWIPERIEEIRIVDDVDDKEGYMVPFVSWVDIREYHCFVVILGETALGRNHDVRPISKSFKVSRPGSKHGGKSHI